MQTAAGEGSGHLVFGVRALINAAIGELSVTNESRPFATAREAAGLFTGLGIQGLSVFALRAGTAAVLREALRVGAAEAVGSEANPDVLLLARLENALRGADGMLLRSAEPFDPRGWPPRADVLVLSSPLPTGDANLPDLLSRIGQSVIASCTIKTGWFTDLVGSLAGRFPYWAVYDYAPLHGSPRAHVAFAREPAMVAQISETRVLEGGRTFDIRVLLDESTRVTVLCGRSGPAREAFREARAAIQADRGRGSAPVLARLRALQERLAALPPLAIAADNFASDQYWGHFLNGLLEYAEVGKVTGDNTFSTYLLALSDAGRYDADLAHEFRDTARFAMRLGRRFDAFFETLHQQRPRYPVLVFNPVVLEVLEESGMSAGWMSPDQYMMSFEGEQLWCASLDGHHRLVAAYLSGAEALDCALTWTNTKPLFPDWKPGTHHLSPERIHVIDRSIARIVASLSRPAA